MTFLSEPPHNEITFIAVENALLVTGIQRVLGQHGLKLIYSAGTLSETLQTCCTLNPGIMILSDRLEPDYDILLLVELVKSHFPDTQLLITGHSQNGHILWELVSRSRCSYLFWYDSFESSLHQAIRLMQQGQLYLSPTAQAAYISLQQRSKHIWSMNERARTVLHLLADGCHAKQIAWQESLTLRQVYGIQRRLRNYFGASTTPQMLVRAAEEGFIPFSR